MTVAAAGRRRDPLVSRAGAGAGARGAGSLAVELSWCLGPPAGPCECRRVAATGRRRDPLASRAGPGAGVRFLAAAQPGDGEGLHLCLNRTPKRRHFDVVLKIKNKIN